MMKIPNHGPPGPEKGRSHGTHGKERPTDTQPGRGRSALLSPEETDPLVLPGSGGAGDRLYRPVRRAGPGDHLSQRHRQRREPRRPDPGGGPSCPGGGRRPRPSRRGRWGESRRGVHRPDGGRGVQDLPGPPGQRHTGQRGLHPAGLAGGHADPFPLRGGIYLRCLLSGEEVLPAYQGGDSLDSILDQVEADLARDPVEPTWETDDTTLHLTPGHPGAAGWTGRPSRDRSWTPWAAATWWN